MFTHTDNPLLAFAIHLLPFAFIAAIACCAAGLIAVSDGRGKTAGIFLTLGAAFLLAVCVGGPKYPSGNFDMDKVVSAIEEQTALESVYIADDVAVKAHRIAAGEDDLSKVPELVGYTNSREVTFKVTLDPDTGEITRLIVVNPAETISGEDLRKPAGS